MEPMITETKPAAASVKLGSQIFSWKATRRRTADVFNYVIAEAVDIMPELIPNLRQQHKSCSSSQETACREAEDEFYAFAIEARDRIFKITGLGKLCFESAGTLFVATNNDLGQEIPTSWTDAEWGNRAAMDFRPNWGSEHTLRNIGGLAVFSGALIGTQLAGHQRITLPGLFSTEDGQPLYDVEFSPDFD